MAYHDLSECTLSPTERMTEAIAIIKMLLDTWDKLNQKEKEFVENLRSSCSVRQLFWLRDIKDKYL